jgi:precorrin-4 methylase
MVEKVVAELAGAYTPDTRLPSSPGLWPDELVVEGALADIAEKVAPPE